MRLSGLCPGLAFSCTVSVSYLDYFVYRHPSVYLRRSLLWVAYFPSNVSVSHWKQTRSHMEHLLSPMNLAPRKKPEKYTLPSQIKAQLFIWIVSFKHNLNLLLQNMTGHWITPQNCRMHPPSKESYLRCCLGYNNGSTAHMAVFTCFYSGFPITNNSFVLLQICCFISIPYKIHCMQITASVSLRGLDNATRTKKSKTSGRILRKSKVIYICLHWQLKCIKIRTISYRRVHWQKRNLQDFPR